MGKDKITIKATWSSNKYDLVHGKNLYIQYKFFDVFKKNNFIICKPSYKTTLLTSDIHRVQEMLNLITKINKAFQRVSDVTRKFISVQVVQISL